MGQRRHPRLLLIVTVVGAAGACRGSSATGDDGTTDASTPAGDGARIDGAPETSLRFAIAGDTRPPNADDTAHYPTAIISGIWADIAAVTPPVDFAVSTGDYMFAETFNTEQNPQLDLYLGARAQFTGPVYAAMGNHECTGYTRSNCGTGTTDGVTANYTAFMTRLVEPNGFDKPWFVVHQQAPDSSWTAKFVFIACNAWTAEQSDWLDTTLAEPTDYTFVVRHEGTTATTAPCVDPSAPIIAGHPLTLMIVGHTHTYAHYAIDREVIVGNGGAPLTSGTNYGYAIVDRRSDGAIELTAYDYQTDATLDHFAVHADGTSAN